VTALADQSEAFKAFPVLSGSEFSRAERLGRNGAETPLYPESED
jgi:hypothetical protein